MHVVISLFFFLFNRVLKIDMLLNLISFRYFFFVVFALPVSHYRRSRLANRVCEIEKKKLNKTVAFDRLPVMLRFFLSIFSAFVCFFTFQLLTKQRSWSWLCNLLLLFGASNNARFCFTLYLSGSCTTNKKKKNSEKSF